MNRVGRSGIKKDPKTILDQIVDFSQVDSQGRNLLHISVGNLDFDGVNYLLEKGVALETDNLNNNLLHTLAKSPYLSKKSDIIAHEESIYKITKLLIEQKVKPKRKNDYEEISYVLAAQKMAYPFLNAIAEVDLKMDAPMENGMNLMHYLLERSSYNPVSEEDEEVIKLTIKALLASGLDAEDKDAFGNTPEDYARKADLRSILGLLQGNDGGADQEVMTLKEAIEKSEYEVAYKIITSGVDLDEVDEKNNMTLLMWFCFTVNIDAVKYLVNRRVNISFQEGVIGNSAIGLLIERGYYNLRGKSLNTVIDILKVLTKGNVDLDAVVDAHGNTALNLVCKQPDFEGLNSKMVDVLIDNDVNLDFPDFEGLTPMMSFAKYNERELNLNIIEALIDEEADVSHIDKYGNTVLSYAAMNSKDSDAKKIAELVLDVDSSLALVVNNEGKSPLDLAIESGNEGCAKVILMNM